TGGAGNTGETGNAGGTGNTSEAGNAGGTGNTSEAGNAGGTGNTSEAGNAGGAGNTGEAGNAGGTGNTGETGNAGGAGNTGETGNAGGTDNTGEAGNAGGTGNTGETGNAGGVGNTGETGNAGGIGTTGEEGGNGKKGKEPPEMVKETAANLTVQNGKNTVTLAVAKRIIPHNTLLTATSAHAVLTDQEIMTSGSEDDNSGSINLSGSDLYSPSAQMSAEEIAGAKKDESSKLESLDLDLREEKIHLAEAQKKVDAGKAVAAFDGVVTHVGDLKNPSSDGTPFLTISSTGGQFIKTAIPEDKYGEIKEGDDLSLMSFSTGESADATVTSISPYPDTSGMFDDGDGATMYPVLAEVSGGVNFSSTDTLQVTLIPSDSMTGDYSGEVMDGGESIVSGTSGEMESIVSGTSQEMESIVSGTSGDMESVISGTSEDGSTIDEGNADMEGMDGNSEPFYLNQAFVRTDDGQPYVYARNDKGRLEKRTVTLGKYGESSWQILGGLTMNDYIAFPYGNDVKEGAKTIEGTISDLYS
ncbi:MAG: hypothetical protein U0L49_07115, partial [Eubacterium sp.]|nr:hypothetical protein [Eubacterium sp.]